MKQKQTAMMIDKSVVEAAIAMGMKKNHLVRTAFEHCINGGDDQILNSFKEHRPKEMCSLVLPPEQYNHVQRLAQKAGVTWSSMARFMIDTFLKSQPISNS